MVSYEKLTVQNVIKSRQHFSNRITRYVLCYYNMFSDNYNILNCSICDEYNVQILSDFYRDVLYILSDEN